MTLLLFGACENVYSIIQVWVFYIFSVYYLHFKWMLPLHVIHIECILFVRIPLHVSITIYEYNYQKWRFLWTDSLFSSIRMDLIYDSKNKARKLNPGLVLPFYDIVKFKCWLRVFFFFWVITRHELWLSQ